MMGFGESLAANLSPTRPPCRPVTKGLMSGTARGFRTQLQPADCGALCTISVNLHAAFCIALLIHVSLMRNVRFREGAKGV